MKPFETINEVSKREMAYNALHVYDYDTDFSFQQLQSMTGFDIQYADRGLVYGVNKLLIRNDKKILVNIRNYGYKIAKPTEQLEHAKWRKKRSDGQLRGAIKEINSTDDNLLTPDEKINKVHLLNHVSATLSVARKHTNESIAQSKDALYVINKAMKELDDIKKKI